MLRLCPNDILKSCFTRFFTKVFNFFVSKKWRNIDKLIIKKLLNIFKILKCVEIVIFIIVMYIVKENVIFKRKIYKLFFTPHALYP